MIDKVKAYLGITDSDKDALLSILWENAECAFEDYTGRAAFEHENIIFKMVIEDYNRSGSEGLSSLSFGSASENYLGDYSDSLQKQIRRNKKIKVM